MRSKLNPSETEEEKRARRAAYSYAHFVRCKKKTSTILPKRTGSVYHERKCGRYKSTYIAWVIPLNGDPISTKTSGSLDTVINRRIAIIKQLIEDGNAREFDILWLKRHEAGESQ
jgi:hypothetical protein